MQEDQNQETNLDEGEIILDPEMKKKQEEKEAFQKQKIEDMREVNSEVNIFLKIMADHGMKVVIAGYSDQYDEIGLWKSNNLSTIEEMGISKVIEKQF